MKQLLLRLPSTFLSSMLLIAMQSILCSQEPLRSESSDHAGVSTQANLSGLDWYELQLRTPWVFLGDSNTYSGGYVAILDAWLHEVQPPLRLLNLGVSSETASGLSEVDHPFKRPCVHERLDKVLTMTRPGVVFVCYGMNDGIYAPPSPERLAAYRAGMLRLAEQVRASGAKLVCLTPPVFEPSPVARQGKLGPTEAGRYAYFAPYPQYDEVLAEQAEWCLENEMGADLVVDIRSVLQAEKTRQLQQDPDFAFSGDGVHFGAAAHALIARQIMAALQPPQTILNSYPNATDVEIAQRRMRILRDAYLSATGKNRPGLPAGLPPWQAERAAENLQ